MFFLAYGLRLEVRQFKLCPSEEPNEAMAGKGPDGRMVPTFTWRTHPPMNRDATGLPSNRILRPSNS